MSELVKALVVLGMAAFLFVFGRWGQRNAGMLSVVPGMDESQIERRRRVYRRGAITCQVLASMFVIVVTLSLVA